MQPKKLSHCKLVELVCVYMCLFHPEIWMLMRSGREIPLLVWFKACPPSRGPRISSKHNGTTLWSRWSPLKGCSFPHHSSKDKINKRPLMNLSLVKMGWSHAEACQLHNGKFVKVRCPNTSLQELRHKAGSYFPLTNCSLCPWSVLGPQTSSEGLKCQAPHIEALRHTLCRGTGLKSRLMGAFLTMLNWHLYGYLKWRSKLKNLTITTPFVNLPADSPHVVPQDSREWDILL